MRRRPHARYSSLTSLLDVLFILLFASLARAAGVVERLRHYEPTPATAEPEPTPPVPVTPPSPPAVGDDVQPAVSREDLHEDALRALAQGLQRRRPLFVRISKDGELVAIDVGAEPSDEDQDVRVPLIERVSDPDIVLSYLGDGTATLRVCTVVMRHLHLDDLSDVLVIIAPEVPLAELPTALVLGLRRDEDRCTRDTQGIAIIVDAGAGTHPETKAYSP